VLSEIARINALTVEDRMARIRSDRREGFGMLWGHSRLSPLECGWAAKKRFDVIVQFAREKHGDVGRDASWDTVSKAVVYAFVARFVEKGRLLTSGSLNSVIDGACKHIRGKLEDHTLVVPCRLWSQGERDEIPIGPVTFQRAEKFFADGSINLCGPGTTSDKLSEEAAALAKESGWVAIVTLPHVDSEVAALRAANAIDAGINVLRILLGPERTRRCRRAESWGPPGKHCYFRLMPGRSLNVAFTWSGREDLMWDNWSEFVFGGQAEMILVWAGAAIHGLTDPQRCLPLQQRFLDAMKWYGDAVSEHSLAARIAKCVFAWERLVVASDRPAPPDTTLTQIVSERTATLCEYVRGERGPALRKHIRDLYDVRSRLAHGSQSPWKEEELLQFSASCEELTVRALIGSLRHYLGLRQGAGTDNELEASFASVAADG